MTSYSRMMALISSNSSYIGFCLPWWIIHFASSDPPRETMPHEARDDQRQVLAQHPSVDREVVDALPGLAFDLPQDDVVAQLLDPPARRSCCRSGTVPIGIVA